MMTGSGDGPAFRLRRQRGRVSVRHEAGRGTAPDPAVVARARDYDEQPGHRREVVFDGCAPWVLVVQHTYYKQLRNNAPGILVQMTASAGFGSGTRHDFA